VYALRLTAWASTVPHCRSPRGQLPARQCLPAGEADLATADDRPAARPVIAAVRLRRGKAADARGAGSFTAEALAIAADAGCTGIRIVRADSRFYNADVVAACRRAGTRFSLTVRMNPHVAAAISAIDEDAWTAIRYPDAFVDPTPASWSPTPRSPRSPTPRSPAAGRRRAGHRPPHRAPRPPSERGSHSRPGRVVHHLALPPGVHRQPVRDAPGRAAAPAARHDRAGDRGRQVRSTCPPSVRQLPGRRRLADPLGDRLRPAAGRPMPGRRESPIPPARAQSESLWKSWTDQPMPHALRPVTAA